MANKVLSIFGLYDLSVKAPTDPVGQWVKIPFANQAQYKASVSEVDQLGDDARQGVFFHTQKGMLTCKASEAAMQVLEKISGYAVTSGATTNPLAVSGTAEILLFQTLGELTPPIMALRATINGRRADGTIGTCTAYWYKCICHTAFETFPDAAYGKIDEVTLNFETFSTLVNENNVAIATSAFGRVEVF